MSDARKALIFWGGWDGHKPKEVAEILGDQLISRGFDVKITGEMESLDDAEYVNSLSLVVPVVTMAQISDSQERNLTNAVKNGVGIAGCHGGMCDSFRNNTEYQFMTGGQWVAHPGNDGINYTVKITEPDHFITQSSPAEFPICSEQYYLHIDPAVKVLATTSFPVSDGPHVPNGPVQMPVIWTKYYGKGKVAYNSLGHQPDIVKIPVVLNLITRGLLWAANAEELA